MTSTVIIFAIPVALLPSAISRVQPTAEFVFLVVAPDLWNSVSTWITAHCLYVLLNIILVTLGLISRAPQTSNDDQVHNSCTFNRSIGSEIESIETKPDVDSGYNNIIVESKSSDSVQNDLSPAASPADQIQKPAAVPIVECINGSLKDLNAVTMTPGAGPGLYEKKSRLRRSTAKLSNLSRETRQSRKMIITESCSPAAPKTSPPRLVVFEISTESMGDYYMQNEEVTMVEGYGESNLKADELYMKAESFIGDFYRQLKMQREDSWNRLCEIYKRSC